MFEYVICNKFSQNITTPLVFVKLWCGVYPLKFRSTGHMSLHIQDIFENHCRYMAWNLPWGMP